MKRSAAKPKKAVEFKNIEEELCSELKEKAAVLNRSYQIQGPEIDVQFVVEKPQNISSKDPTNGSKLKEQKASILKKPSVRGTKTRAQTAGEKLGVSFEGQSNASSDEG